MEKGIPTAVELSVRKTGSGGKEFQILIAGPAQQQLLYTSTVESGFFKPTVVHLHHVLPDGQLERPFATIKGRHVSIRENPMIGTESTMTTRDFLYSPGAFSKANRFMVRGQEFKLESKRAMKRKLELHAANASNVPLAHFKPNSRWSSEKGVIDIPASSVAVGPTAPGATSTLLQDGRPTWLLDMAIVAEHIFRVNQSKNSSAAAMGAAVASGGG